MPSHRKVFFSFHYARDSWRASQVRNSGLLQTADTRGRFFDKAEWEQLKRDGDQAIRNWITRQMDGTSVTVVLIGQETATRQWVREEIAMSRRKGNGMLGIRIHNIADWAYTNGGIDRQGPDPFAQVMDPLIPVQTLGGRYRTYTWDSSSRLLLPDWIEQAARDAGR